MCNLFTTEVVLCICSLYYPVASRQKILFLSENFLFKIQHFGARSKSPLWGNLGAKNLSTHYVISCHKSAAVCRKIPDSYPQLFTHNAADSVHAIGGSYRYRIA